MKTFADMEAMVLPQMNGCQGKRINARLQAALNYAMAQEMEMGEPINANELVDGIVNGAAAMIAMTWMNIATRDGKDHADLIGNAILRGIQRQWSQQRHEYIRKLQFDSRITINPHRGSA